MKADDKLLALIIELNGLLQTALQSLGGKTTDGEVSYLVWATTHVSRLVAGYIELRKCGLAYASKIMVRPVLESSAVAVAAVKKPEFFLYRAFKEHDDAKKLLKEVRAIFKSRNHPTDEIDHYTGDMENQWRRFEKDRIKRRPSDANRPKSMTFKQTLELIGLDEWYAQYRIYSHFTHGAVRAAAGDFDGMTDEPDNLIIGWSMLAILFALKQYAPVDLPDLSIFPKRLTAFMKE